MAANSTEYFTLPNGLRLVCAKVPSKVDYFGLAINAGSRDEKSGLHGLAHFVEHTIFKGTTHRRACHIINRMEAVGGELNAFTTKEETNVYSIFPHGNLARAVELIADLTRNSVFPERELTKEREVVREEIDSYLDTPSEAVFDDFENLIFNGSDLGHNILGEAEGLNSFTSEVCRRWIESNYTPSRMVAFYQGSMSAARVLSIVERHFADLPADSTPLHRQAPAAVAPFVQRREIDSHQAHCVCGATIPGIYSAERQAIGLLTNILGGPGMNSRLNIALRERHGLVYTVDASAIMMSDCGLSAIYFGCDPADADRCTELVMQELHRLSTQPLTKLQLAAAKKQYLGQLVVASDNREQTALNAARATLYFNRVPSVEEVRTQILNLTPDDLMQAANHFSPSRYSRLTLG